MNRSLRFLFSAAALALLAACGAKGPLFLPEKPAPEDAEVPADAVPADEDGADAQADEASAQPPIEAPEPASDDAAPPATP